MSNLHHGFLGLFLLRLTEHRHDQDLTVPATPIGRRLFALFRRGARRHVLPVMRIDDHLRRDIGVPTLDSTGRGRRHR